jgi:DNA-3-methyladenine glycosylase II
MRISSSVFPLRKAILQLKKSDTVICRLIEEIGPCRIRFLDAGFEALAKAIIFQQLSGKAAATIFARLVAAAGNGRLTPESVLQLTPARMGALGLSRQKILYIRELARQTKAGEIDFQALAKMSDEEAMHFLTGLKGVGVWTAHMFLIFALRRMDVLPSGDLGIRAAIRKAYGMPQLPTLSQVEDVALNWRPYSTIASWYLWRSLEPDANL